MSAYDPIAEKLVLELVERLRPIAKTKPVRPELAQRDGYKSKAHAAFVAGVDEMLKAGASKRSIADDMGIDIHTLVDVYEGKRTLQAWMIAALPHRARVEFFRAGLGWSEPPRSGTDG
jgi:hypothetical protein